VTHFIRPNGPFDRLCSELLSSGFVIPFVEAALEQQLDPTVNPDDPQVREAVERQKQKAEDLRRKKAASKTCFVCPDCAEPQRLWGKLELNVICGECGAPFEVEDEDRRRERKLKAARKRCASDEFRGETKTRRIRRVSTRK
jgi:transcription initiation factor IIE alpha subunit